MRELLDYSLGDLLMFAPETYLRLFVLHNAALWPLHLLVAALTVAVVFLARDPGTGRGRFVAGLLAAAWAFVAWSFLLQRYAGINLAAPWFARGFMVEALLLFAAGATGRLQFAWRSEPGGRLGLALLGFAAVLLPLLGLLGGREWRGVEVFALTPDATAIGTLGLLLTSTARHRWALMLLPLVWCLASGLTYVAMERPAGLVGPVVAALAVLLGAVLRYRARPYLRMT
jgi:hypothetical protein